MTENCCDRRSQDPSVWVSRNFAMVGFHPERLMSYIVDSQIKGEALQSKSWAN